MSTNSLRFTFSDLIMGYVTGFDPERDAVSLRTSDGRVFEASIRPNAWAQILRNLGEPYQDVTSSMRDMLTPGRLVFAYGAFMPQAEGTRFDLEHLVFLGKGTDEVRFEDRTWWVEQISQLADYYLHAEFDDGPPDWSRYRTALSADGLLVHEDTHRQECDTISRLIYGFASAYLLTGEDRYLDACESGTRYLRENFRATDSASGATYWYYAIDRSRDAEGNATGDTRKILASQNGDDYNTVPAYEQIYALAGPTQTLRITGDREIVADIEATVALFDRYFLDPERGGYFSHVDPVRFDPHSPDLGVDRARKNWNSIGDHAPAYLINSVLATGNKRLVDMLATTADTIVEHFGDYENSPFVNERFHEDWSMDQSRTWQQNRAVVGHNLKIAWNLMRVHSLVPKQEYVAFAERIAALMPATGGDQQRGGWYDLIERVKGEDEPFFAFGVHDRKAFWQQEQGILAYLLLAGILDKPEYRKLARESCAFYNAWFLDHDSGGVYFNVLANGIPYLMGTERFKGSHSMAGYHSFELCYLAATYSNLLLTGQSLDLHFKPYADQLPDRVLTVAPDLLPPGRARIGRVWVDDVPHEDFDAEAMTIRLPQDSSARPTVRVTLLPTSATGSYDVDLNQEGGVSTLVLAGVVDTRALDELSELLNQLVDSGTTKIELDLYAADSLSPEVLRAIAFAAQKLPQNAEFTARGGSPRVTEQLEAADLELEIQ